MKQHEIDWDIAELIMNSIYRIWVSYVIKQMINCQVKQDEIEWDIAKLMVISIYRIWAIWCHQTNNK